MTREPGVQEQRTYYLEAQDEQSRREQGILEDDGFYELVAEQVRQLGFPQVNGATVDAVHQRQQNREKILHPINQVIAWNLWWQLHHGEEELPA